MKHNEVYPTGTGFEVRGFTYMLEYGQKPETDVVQRTKMYRALREGLTQLPVGEWLKIPVEITGKETTPQKVLDRLRAAVYNWAGSAGLEAKGFEIRTVNNLIDDTHAILWVIVQETPKIILPPTVAAHVELESLQAGPGRENTEAS